MIYLAQKYESRPLIAPANNAPFYTASIFTVHL